MLFQQEPYQVHSNRYGLYCIPNTDLHRPIPRIIIKNGVSEPETVDKLRQRTGNLVTAGAYFGDFLPPLSRPDRTVWTFEPNPRSFRAAATTIHLNNLANINLQRVALSSIAGFVSMKIQKDGVSIGGCASIVNEEEYDIMARCDLLDNLLPESINIDTIHFDLEGHEEEAIKGSIKTITRCKPLLILETVPQWIFDNLPYKRAGILDHRNTILVPL